MFYNNKQEDNIESEFKKLVEEAQELKEISDMYVAFIKQKMLNSYCKN